MFLHSGAGLHGHEYSNRNRRSVSPQRVNRRPPLLRSAFTSHKSRPQCQADGSVPVPLQVSTPVSVHVQRAPAEVVSPRDLEQGLDKDKDEDDEEDEEQPGALMNTDTRPRPVSDASNFSQSPETSSTRSPTRRRRRMTRKSTRYALAYPAPRFAGGRLVVQKVNPKLYLQLQQVSAATRPVPVIDVFPSSRIAGPVITPRLAKRFPRLFGGRGLSAGDVVLMQSDDYDLDPHRLESEEDESRFDKRKLLAIFSPLKKSDLTEIVLDDGSVWVAQPRSTTGSFDFVHVDSHGIRTTARWARRAAVPPSKARPSVDGTLKATSSSSGDPSEARYTFSIMSPSARRHPVLATLTRSGLDIRSHYTAVTTSSSGIPPIAPQNQWPRTDSQARLTTRSGQPAVNRDESGSEALLPSDPEHEPSTHPVDEATARLISITAIWLALRCGWSPYYKPPAAQVAEQTQTPPSSAPGPSVTSAPSATAAKPSRRCTWSHRDSLDGSTSFGPRPIELIEPAARPGPATPRTSMIGRQQPEDCRRDQPPATPLSAIPPSVFQIPHSSPRRATSTGAAFMQRRIQMQSSGPSDTEYTNVVSSTRRQGPGRILSGDWAPSLGRISRPLSLHGRISSVVVSRDHSPVPSSSRFPPPRTGFDEAGTLSERPGREASPPPGGRRVQSAYYPSNFVRLELDDRDDARKADTHEVENGAPGAAISATREDPGPRNRLPEDDNRKGVAGKLKSFGHWFRRLGAQ